MSPDAIALDGRVLSRSYFVAVETTRGLLGPKRRDSHLGPDPVRRSLTHLRWTEISHGMLR
jgi:hypothetical protein